MWLIVSGKPLFALQKCSLAVSVIYNNDAMVFILDYFSHVYEVHMKLDKKQIMTKNLMKSAFSSDKNVPDNPLKIIVMTCYLSANSPEAD